MLSCNPNVTWGSVILVEQVDFFTLLWALLVPSLMFLDCIFRQFVNGKQTLWCLSVPYAFWKTRNFLHLGC